MPYGALITVKSLIFVYNQNVRHHWEGPEGNKNWVAGVKLKIISIVVDALHVSRFVCKKQEWFNFQFTKSCLRKHDDDG